MDLNELSKIAFNSQSNEKLIKDSEFINEGISSLFRQYIEERFEENPENFLKIYYELSDDYDFEQYTGVRSLMQFIEDDGLDENEYVMSMIINYFDETSDKIFLKKILKYTCSEGEYKKLNKINGQLTGGKSIRKKDLETGSMTFKAALLLSIWCSKNSSLADKAIRITKYVKRDNRQERYERKVISSTDPVSKKIRKRLDKKANKPIVDAIAENYMKISPESFVQAVLPGISDDILKKSAELAISAICDAEAVLAVHNITNAPISHNTDEEKYMLKAANEISLDYDKILYEANYLTAFFAVILKNNELMEKLIKAEKESYNRQDSRLAKKVEKITEKAKKDKNEISRQLDESRKENKKLKIRAEQAEERLRQEKKKKPNTTEKEKALDEEIRILKKAKMKTESENSHLKDQIKNLKKQIEEANIKNKKNTNKTILSEDEIIKISNEKYLFVCDKDAMKNKVKEWFPNSVISDGTDVRKHMNIKLAIFLCAEVSHGEYYRIKEICRKSGIPMLHSMKN